MVKESKISMMSWRKKPKTKQPPPTPNPQPPTHTQSKANTAKKLVFILGEEWEI